MSDSRVRKLPLEESKREVYVADISIVATIDRKYSEKTNVRRAKVKSTSSQQGW